MTVAIRNMRLSSQVAARPIAWGKLVARLERRGHVLHLGDLLLERHAADEVADAHLEWELLVLVGRRLRLHPPRVAERVAQQSGGEQHPLHAGFRSAGESASLPAKND